MRPLKITCNVLTPVVSYGHGLNLDGMLQYAAFLELTDEEKAELEDISTTDFPEDFDLPVKKWRCPVDERDQVDERLLDSEGRIWGWCTSDVVCEWQGRQPVAVRRPAPTNAMRRMTDSKVVNVSGGRYKPLNRQFEAMWPRDGLLIWYAIGEPDGVARLLEHVPNIGKLHNHGHGLIERELDGTPIWTVEPHDDIDAWQHRKLPRNFDPNRPANLAPIRAPRWHRSRYALCVDAC